MHKVVLALPVRADTPFDWWSHNRIEDIDGQGADVFLSVLKYYQYMSWPVQVMCLNWPDRFETYTLKQAGANYGPVAICGLLIRPTEPAKEMMSVFSKSVRVDAEYFWVLGGFWWWFSVVLG